MDGLIIKQPYASMVIERKKEWELRSRAPPQNKIKNDLFLLSSGLAFGNIKIVDHWLANKKELSRHKRKHRSSIDLLDDDFEINVWEIDVVKQFKRPKKYVHPIGARVWVNDVSFTKQPSIIDFF